MGCVKCSYKDNLRKKQVKKSFILDFFSGCFSVALSQKSESFSFRIFYLRRRYTITLKEKRKMQTDVIIQTERLTLREMTHDDYDILYAVLSDSDIMRHYPYTFDEKRVRGWIDRNRQRYSDFGFELWAVCLRTAAVARANGMTLTDEFTDDEGERSLVYQITRTEWLKNN